MTYNNEFMTLNMGGNVGVGMGGDLGVSMGVGGSRGLVRGLRGSVELLRSLCERERKKKIQIFRMDPEKKKEVKREGSTSS